MIPYWDNRFGDPVVGFRVHGLGFMVVGSRVSVLGVTMQCLGFRT